jgi:hypothetical protein
MNELYKIIRVEHGGGNRCGGFIASFDCFEDALMRFDAIYNDTPFTDVTYYNTEDAPDNDQYFATLRTIAIDLGGGEYIDFYLTKELVF